MQTHCPEATAAAMPTSATGPKRTLTAVPLECACQAVRIHRSHFFFSSGEHCDCVLRQEAKASK